MEERNLLDSLSLKALWAVQTKLHQRVLEEFEEQRGEFLSEEIIDLLNDISSMSKILYERFKKLSEKNKVHSTLSS